MKLKSTIAMLVLAAGACPMLASAADDRIGVRDLAQISGLSERHVRMLIHARTPYAESRYAFRRIEEKFVDAIGEKQYRDLVAGKPVRLEGIVDGERVAVVIKLSPRT